MTWKPELEELKKRKELAVEMGRPESVTFHHSRGKLTVRERIDKLGDEGSFEEIGGPANRP